MGRIGWAGATDIEGKLNQPALNIGFRVFFDRAGGAVRYVCHRCFHPAHCGLAGEPFDADGFCGRRTRAGALRPPGRTRPVSLFTATWDPKTSRSAPYERPVEVEITPSVGSLGDNYDNSPAETINGPYETDLIDRRAPWESGRAVEHATLNLAHWFNQQKRLKAISDILVAEAGVHYARPCARDFRAAA